MAGEIQLNSVSLATESSGTVTLNSSTDIKGCINASGSAPIYACRAWVNFDGTSASIGTGNANGNVSGISDNGTGDYTVTFATAMPDAYYAVSGSSGENTASTLGRYFTTMVYDATYIEVFTTTSAGSLDDCASVSVAVFR